MRPCATRQRASRARATSSIAVAIRSALRLRRQPSTSRDEPVRDVGSARRAPSGIGASAAAFVNSALAVIGDSTDARPASISNIMMPSGPQIGSMVDLRRRPSARATCTAACRPSRPRASGSRLSALGRHRRSTCVVRAERLRDAEVEHLDLAGVRDEHVLRLEIAMDDAELVRARRARARPAA